MTLKYDPSHPKNGENVELTTISLVMYDTNTKGVVHVQEYPLDMSLIELRADFIMALEAHASSYTKDVWKVVEASEDAAKRKRTGKPLLNVQAGIGLVQRVANRLEDAFKRLSDWHGEQEFSVLLPYAEIHTGGMQRPDDEVNLENSRPYINGVLFVLKPFDPGTLPGMKKVV